MIHAFLRRATLALIAFTGISAHAAPCPTTAFTPSTTLPAATVGVPYSQVLGASNSSNAVPFTFAVSAGLSSGSGLAITSTGPTSATFAGTPTQVGNHRVTLVATDALGCSGGRTYALAIGQGSQTISFTSVPPATATIGGATYTVTATATSGLAAVFSIAASASSVCSIAGSTVSFIGAGTCVINANQAGNANYAAAPQAQQSFGVGLASQTITFTSTAPTTAMVGGASYTVAATASSGLAVAFGVDASAIGICSISGNSVSFQAVGICVINANQAGNANYNAAPQVQQSFAVGKASQTISFTSTAPAAATVAGATYIVTATATSGLAATFSIAATSSAVCSIAGSTVSFIGAGSCVINANQAGNANYNAAPQVQQSFAVGKASQTISFTSTAPATATVAGATYIVTATATSGLAATFTIAATSSAVCSIAGSTVNFVGAGSCVINANQAGNANYNAAAQVQQSFAVGKGSQTVTITSSAPATATVGGAGYSVSATATSGLPVAFTINGGSTGVCSIVGNLVSFQAGGTCVVNANQAGNANYNAAPQVQQTFPVAKASQTISFTSTAPAASVGGEAYMVSAIATSGLAVEFSIAGGSSAVCSISDSDVTFQSVGTCVVIANQAGDASFNAAAPVQQSFVVGKGSQVITFESSPPDFPEVGGSYSVSATATSGLAVSLSINASSNGICSISGSSVSLLAVGDCVIDATQSGDGNWNAAVPEQQSFTIEEAGDVDVGAYHLNGSCGTLGVQGPGFTLTAASVPLPVGTNVVITGSGVQNIGVFSVSGGSATVEVLSPTSRRISLTAALPGGATIAFRTTLSISVAFTLNAVTTLASGYIATGAKPAANVSSTLILCSAT